MSRFADYFGQVNNTCVETDDGTFTLCTVQDKKDPWSKSKLYFILKDGREIYVDWRIRCIAPFGTNGVACCMFLPQGDKKINVYIYKDGGIISTNAFINRQNELFYVYDGELRLAKTVYDDSVVVNKEQFAQMGYEGKIGYEDDYFKLPASKVELIKANFFNYDLNPFYSKKQQKTAQEIMLYIKMSLSKSKKYDSSENKMSNRLYQLSWDAKSADISNVLEIIKIKKKQNDLSKKEAQKILTIINALKKAKKEQFFGRYMELILTAGNGIGEKQKDYRYDISTVVHTVKIIFDKSDVILDKLLKRDDFDYLLFDAAAFEGVVYKMYKDEII